MKIANNMIFIGIADDTVLATIPNIIEVAGTYSEEDLSVLAIWFTVVKIIYVQGALFVLPTLCQFLGKFTFVLKLTWT